jgi:hypothetical protein
MFRRRFTVNNLSLSTVQASFVVLLRVVERRIKVQSQPVPLVGTNIFHATFELRSRCIPIYVCPDF